MRCCRVDDAGSTNVPSAAPASPPFCLSLLYELSDSNVPSVTEVLFAVRILSPILSYHCSPPRFKFCSYLPGRPMVCGALPRRPALLPHRRTARACSEKRPTSAGAQASFDSRGI